MKQIKHRYTEAVLYEYKDGMSLRHALEKATTEKANLYGADLYGANLYGANLRGASLREANLRGASLREADLYGANLYGANLYGADLRGANLREADLYGANLYGANLRGADLGDHGKLVGERPFFQCGPIGSRADSLLSFITDRGVVIKTGCFTGTLDEFRAAVENTHGDGIHAKEYQAAMLMIEARAAIWIPDAAKEQA